MKQTDQTNPSPSTTKDTDDRRRLIRALNDEFRHLKTAAALKLGKVVLTAGIAAWPYDDQQVIMALVRKFYAFTDVNDAWGEHDFGAFEYRRERIFWKIDYYDRSLKHGSPDASDAELTCRVLTVMLAEEY
jgi:Protein of unknown function (DUF3768)